MSSRELSKLSGEVNSQARKQYPRLARQIGRGSLMTSLAPRVALRLDTPYPYSFTEDDNLFPKGDKSFGRVIKRSREEGLREIHASIAGADQKNEHKWLYIPEISSWIDTSLATTEVDVDADQYAHVFLSHIFSEIEAVHTHPDATVRNLAEDESAWGYSDNYLLESARPSGNDLMGHAQMAARTARSSKTVDSVVSHYGVTTFSANEIGAGDGYTVSAAPYEQLIEGSPINPIVAIRTALDALQSHYVRFDSDTPAFLFGFEPLA